MKQFKHGSTGYRYHKCRCDICTKEATDKHRQWTHANYEHSLAEARKRHKDRYSRLRKQAITALGGKCTECGIDDIRVLQIDHIYNDGKNDRKNFSRLDTMFLHIIKNGHQNKYQVLCANCHVLKTYYLK